MPAHSIVGLSVCKGFFILKVLKLSLVYKFELMKLDRTIMSGIQMSSDVCFQCIQYSVQQCDDFASTRRKHKTFLIEKEMILILNR